MKYVQSEAFIQALGSTCCIPVALGSRIVQFPSWKMNLNVEFFLDFQTVKSTLSVGSMVLSF